MRADFMLAGIPRWTWTVRSLWQFEQFPLVLHWFPHWKIFFFSDMLQSWMQYSLPNALWYLMLHFAFFSYLCYSYLYVYLLNFYSVCYCCLIKFALLGGWGGGGSNYMLNSLLVDKKLPDPFWDCYMLMDSKLPDPFRN